MSQTVNLIFDPEEMFVRIVTDKAIGLSDDEFSEVSIWIPTSQIESKIPSKGDWIDTIEVSKWLADDNDWDYE